MKTALLIFIGILFIALFYWMYKKSYGSKETTEEPAGSTNALIDAIAPVITKPIEFNNPWDNLMIPA